MPNILKGIAGVVGISILTACTGGQVTTPPVTSVNVAATTKLEFAVGTALYADGKTYLNTLVTYRQPNGLSATLYNSPSIAGPTGFTVPAAASAGTDAGTSNITSTPPTQPGTKAVATTFAQNGGAFAYGFANANSTTSGSANYPKISNGAAANNGIYADTGTIIDPTSAGAGSVTAAGGSAALTNFYPQPLYLGSSSKLPFLLGPPAVPSFNDGTFPAGFAGYGAGFTMFGAAPVAGAYTLTVNVPSGTIGQLQSTQTATSTLASAVSPIAVTASPTMVLGGGTGTFTVGALPAGATHQVLFVVDVPGGTGSAKFYSFDATAGGAFTLAATAGPKGTAPINSGDSVFAYVVASDYDVIALAPPTNLSQSPAVPAAADISVSKVKEQVAP